MHGKPAVFILIGSHSRSKDKCMYLLYILANSVTNNKGKQQASVADNSDGSVVNGATVDFSLKELYAIEAIQAEKNLFRLLVRYKCFLINKIMLNFGKHFLSNV